MVPVEVLGILEPKEFINKKINLIFELKMQVVAYDQLIFGSDAFVPISNISGSKIFYLSLKR